MPCPRGIKPTTLESYASAGWKLLPVLASTGSGISAWFILCIRDQLSVPHILYSETRVCLNFCPLRYSNPGPVWYQLNIVYQAEGPCTVRKSSWRPTWSRPKCWSKNHHWIGDKRPSSPHTIPCSGPPIAGLYSHELPRPTNIFTPGILNPRGIIYKHHGAWLPACLRPQRVKFFISKLKLLSEFLAKI